MFKSFEEMDVTHQAAYKMGYWDGLKEINKIIERANTRFERKLHLGREDRDEEDHQGQHTAWP